MRRIQRLSIVTIVSLMPALAWTAPPGDGPPEDPGASLQQGQSSDGRTQQQGPDSQTQANPTAPPAPPPGGWGPPPTIQVNPQIQVQVNPRVDVEAKPQADAKADADANADAQANPKAEANAEIDTDIKSESNIEGGQDGVSGAPAPTPEAPPKTVVKIIHRPTPLAPPNVDRPAKRRSGLMVAGLFTFGASYIGTAVNGAYIYEHCDRARDEGACRQMSTKMLIPVAGPFMAIQDSDLRSNQVKLGLLGGVQAAGALMTVAGMVMHVRDGKKPGHRFVDADGVRVGKQTRLAPLAGGTGGGLKVNVRF